MGSTDPVAHSLAESLFWLDQEFEHTNRFNQQGKVIQGPANEDLKPKQLKM
jgi:hypothetical protein